MRIKIYLELNGLTFNKNYQHSIQALIYKLMGDKKSKELHDNTGYKFFTFSNLIGKKSSTIAKETYLSNGYLYISSLDDEIINNISQNLSLSDSLIIEEKEIRIIKYEVINISVIPNTLRMRTLSPVTVHKTTLDKKTIYYSPFDAEFHELIKNNIIKKMNLDNSENIMLYDFDNVEKRLFNYKNFIIESYDFDCTITCSKEIIEKILNTGLGDRNSYGFGMVDIDIY